MDPESGSDEPLPPANPAAGRDRPDRERPAAITSEALLGERRALAILHRGQCYTLRITANDKLILTK